MSKISVIIPVYNVENYLGECLDSLIGQTLQDIEIICIDDGSTDKSPEILAEYVNKDNRIKVVQQKNQYAGVARNNGLKIANGDYIYFLDPDDYIMPKCLESLYKKILSTKADICFIKCKEYDEENKKLYKLSDSLKTNLLKGKKVFSVTDIAANIFQVATVSLSSKLYSKDFLDKTKVQFQNIKTTNDVYFNYVNLLSAKKITYLNKYLMVYRRNRPNCLTLQRGKTFDNVRFAYQKIKEFIENNNFPKEIKDSFYKRAYIAFFAECKIGDNLLSMDSIKDFFPNEYWNILNTDEYNLETKIFNINFLQKIFSIRTFNNRKIMIILGKKFFIS